MQSGFHHLLFFFEELTPLQVIPESILGDISANLCLHNSLTHLDLSKNKLEVLPDAIFNCGTLSPRLLPPVLTKFT